MVSNFIDEGVAQKSCEEPEFPWDLLTGWTHCLMQQPLSVSLQDSQLILKYTYTYLFSAIRWQENIMFLLTIFTGTGYFPNKVELF